MFFVVVVDHSQEERHEDISVDDDKGDEEQGVPGAEVKRWHPKRRGGALLLARVMNKESESMRKQTPTMISKCHFGLPGQTCQIKAKNCIRSAREHLSSTGFSSWFIRP